MAIKKISNFTEGVPSQEDFLLYEDSTTNQGKSTTVKNLLKDVNADIEGISSVVVPPSDDDFIPKEWNKVTFPENGVSLRHTTFVNGAFYTVATVAHSRAKFYKSTDGINWAFISDISNSTDCTALTYADGKFIVGCFDNSTYMSTNDGLTWTKSDEIFCNYGYEIYSVIHGAGKFFTINDGGMCFVSTDGINWELHRDSGIVFGSYSHPRYAYGDNKFVVVTNEGRIITATNDLVFTVVNSDTDIARNITFMDYLNNTFVAGYSDGSFAFSTNGIEWVKTPARTNSVKQVIYTNGKYFALSDNARISYSTDLISWVDVPNAVFNDTANAICFGNDMFIVSGENSNIETCTDYGYSVVAESIRTQDGERLLDKIDTQVSQLKNTLVNNIVSLTSRSRRNITNDLANLPTAIAEQNLEKYEYKIGDYFIGQSGYQYNLADMDSYYGGYNAYAVVGTHHCGIVVDTKSTCQWLSSGTATSYSVSDLHAFLKGTVLNNIKSDMIALFGGTTGLEHLLSHTEFDNGPDGWGTTWDGLANTYICALSESQVYGNVWSTNGYQTGTANKKLELFSKYRFNEIFGNISIHLRSLRSASNPCYANYAGYADYWGLTSSGRACGLILFY